MPLHIPNSTSHPFHLLQTPVFQGYVTNRIVLELLEASPAWQEANGKLEPLVSELAKLEAQLANEIEEKGRKQNALNSALEAALETARLAALESPAVLKAKRDLEALDQPAAPKGKARSADISEVS